MSDHFVTGSVPRLEAWRASIQAAEERCFWPGPRPMSNSRWSDQLIGRGNEAHKFSDLVRNTSLVVLNGESGVGKSSMLNLGITPQLREDGFLVLTCRKWATSRANSELPQESRGVECFISEMLEDQLPQLHDEYGDEAVIILDQFEGLIRHQPRFYNEVRRWIEGVVKRYDIHVVISLRTEFMHRIGDLKVGPYKRADFKLDRISDPNVIGRIVREGTRVDGSSNAVIDDDATSFIVERWKVAEGGLAWTNVGLLHLQAFLYFLWQRIGSADTTITLADVVTATEVLGATDNAVSLFENALARAVGLRLDRCRDVYVNELNGDRTLAEGVASLLTRIPVHLESGGYKVSQESRQLAAKVLSRELETLREVNFDRGRPAGDMFSAFVGAASESARSDWLDALRSDLAPDESLRALLTDQAANRDDDEGTSGPMLGMPPLAVLTEELRRYFFALAWLEQSDIVVPADADGGETMLELVHDGFSRGLKEWATINADGPERTLYRLTASIGEVFDWRDLRRADAPFVSQGIPPDDGRVSINANLRWRSCRVVGMEFRRRVFVNCDFRESNFVGCLFEGVTFINCLLDGVSFIECTIQGETSDLSQDFKTHELDRDEERKQLLPSFLVEAPELAATLNRYRDRPVGGATELVSWTSGGPAQPISLDLADQVRPGSARSVGDSQAGKPASTEAFTELANFRFLTWTVQQAGLAMYGGRLSSLMFGDCVVSGKISLRHVAGTSLEFGGLRTGAIELYDVAIRGFSISPPVERAIYSDANLTYREDIKVSAIDSALQNVWFSTPLRGRATITNSVVWHLFSASRSDSKGFIVELPNSPHLGLFNVPAAEGFLAAKEANYVPGGRYHDAVENLAKRVDYQSLKNLRAVLPKPPEE